MVMTPTTNDPHAPELDRLAAAFPAYDLEVELGRGGMGAVYRARHKKLDRHVAIKLLLPEHDGPEFAERFERRCVVAVRGHHQCPGSRGKLTAISLILRVWFLWRRRGHAPFDLRTSSRSRLLPTPTLRKLLGSSQRGIEGSTQQRSRDG